MTRELHESKLAVDRLAHWIRDLSTPEVLELHNHINECVAWNNEISPRCADYYRAIFNIDVDMTEEEFIEFLSN